MSSWHNRLKRRQARNRRPVVARYEFSDGTVIDGHGDGSGQRQAAHRLLTAPLGSELRYRVRRMVA